MKQVFKVQLASLCNMSSFCQQSISYNFDCYLYMSQYEQKSQQMQEASKQLQEPYKQ